MSQTIGAEERGLAAMTHLSGLAGYIIPGGGVIVPIIIWIVLTVILAPVAIVGWIVLALAAIALPVVGALKASDGNYYRYPVIGIEPR